MYKKIYTGKNPKIPSKSCTVSPFPKAALSRDRCPDCGSKEGCYDCATRGGWMPEDNYDNSPPSDGEE